MSDRGNHYERAFAAYLRALRIACIPVDESRRTFTENEPIKSLDFVVNRGPGRWLLIDVKGRRVAPRRKTLETWATADDVASLGRWELTFGPGAVALLVFAYALPSDWEPLPALARFDFDAQHYGFCGIALPDYRGAMRTRSVRWKTVGMPLAEFRRHSRPVTAWLEVGDPAQVRLMDA